jgi:hypothetical protein
MEIAFEHTGIQAVLSRFRLLPGRFQQAVDAASEEVGQMIVQEVRAVLDEQKFEKLSGPYYNWKARYGYDQRILFRRGFLYDNIYWMKTGRNSGAVRVRDIMYPPMPHYGTRKRRPGKPKQYSMAYVAKVHQEGRGNNPQRPFFSMAADRVRAKSYKIFYREIKGALR